MRVARDFSDPDRVYLMLRKQFGWRLYLSSDGGRSYTRIRTLPPVPGDFWLDRKVGGRVYLMEGLDLLKSDDQGVTWDPVGTAWLSTSPGGSMVGVMPIRPVPFAAAGGAAARKRPRATKTTTSQRACMVGPPR